MKSSLHLPRPASCALSGGLGAAGWIFWLKSLWRGKAVVLGDFLGRERPGDRGSVAGGGDMLRSQDQAVAM